LKIISTIIAIKKDTLYAIASNLRGALRKCLKGKDRLMLLLVVISIL